MSSFPGEEEDTPATIHAPTSDAGSAGSPNKKKKSKGGPSFKQEVQNTSVGMLGKIFRVANFATCGLLIAASVLSFLATPTISSVLLSIYCIIFSCILCCFETHLGWVLAIAYRDFGFMFRWQGRILFLLFVASLAFGLGSVVGYVAAGLAVLNVFFTTYVLCYHKQYKMHMKQEEARFRTKNLEMMKQVKVAEQGFKTTKAIEQVTGVNVAAVAAQTAMENASMETSNPSWEKIYDEESGAYYYYNATTKETRWDPPN